MFVIQALGVLAAAARLTLRIVERWLPSGKQKGLANPDTSSQHLIEVTPARGRVLCPYSECLGVNDERFRFCQHCGKPKDAPRRAGTDKPMDINESAITKRFREFRTEVAETATVKSRCATTQNFARFLQSRKTGRVVLLQEAQPKDVVEYLCYLDSCGSRRRTVVHARECQAVGTPTLDGCSTRIGVCTKRYAHESLRTNHVSKLAVTFEKELGCIHDWDNHHRNGNPVRSDMVNQYMRFTTKQQKKAGVLVKQAPALLRGHLFKIVTPMRTRLQLTASGLERITLARDIAFYTVAFSTTKRGDELVNTLIQRIMRLPNKSGLIFNFQWGKTQRDGADHHVAVGYDSENLTLCPVRAVEQYVEVGKALGWDMTAGYLFPVIADRGGVPKRGTKPVTPSYMTQELRTYTRQAGVDQEFSVHSFRSGGAISRALAGDSLESIMQKAYWKNPKTAWRYMRLLDVVAPGYGGEGMVAGVSEAEFQAWNEFPLSEQSRAFAAFGKKPLI